jgi:hypothetical protein
MKRAPLSHSAYPRKCERCQAVLSWTDIETGERLTIEMEGSRSFLQELEQLGFEILSEREVERPTAPLSGGGSGTEERSSAGEDGDRTRTGPVLSDESFRVFRQRDDESLSA